VLERSNLEAVEMTEEPFFAIAISSWEAKLLFVFTYCTAPSEGVDGTEVL
jgi:hypothetical protein